MSAPPGVTITPTAEGERVRLEAVRGRRSFSPVLFFAGFLGLPLLAVFALPLLAERVSSSGAAALAVVALLGASGGLSLGWTHILERLSRRKRGAIELSLTPLALTADGEAHPWGELAGVWPVVGGLRLETHAGRLVKVEAPHQPHQRLRWLAEHLEQARVRFAPGSPEDLPESMRALREAARRTET